ncbi:MAG: DsbC family protein [Proteobacteria bacterium]|nr:DsbC family protein [Pseudomonadota bacterium]
MKKMVMCLMSVIGMLLFFNPVFVFAQADNAVLEQFKKSFPQVKVDEFKKADIDGLYEVITAGKVLYYFAQKNYIFDGAIWTSSGKNLTREREGEVITKKIKDVPLDKGLKIGSGENIVLEFTDPDCPYCRQASKFFAQQKNVTRYVYFSPLPSHKDAEQKVKYILCAKDKEKAYEEAMTGKLDGKKIEPCSDENAMKLFNEQKQIITVLGLNSTPQFWVNGKHVSGANIPLIESLLKKESPKGK